MVRITERYARDLTVQDWNLFKSSLDSWILETGHHSNLAIRYQNQHHRYLRKFATDYLPFFFLALSVRPTFVYSILTATLREIPYDRNKYAGNVPVMNDCWLRYGIEEGFIEFERVDSRELRERIMNAPLEITPHNSEEVDAV